MGETPGRGAAQSASSSDRDFLVRTARRAVVGGVVLAVVFGLLWILKAALTPLAAAFVIAYLLDPLIDRFEARRVARSIAIFLLLGVVGVVLLSGVLVVVPRLQQEVSALAERMPGYLERLVTVVIPEIEQRTGVALPHTIQDVIGRVRAGEIPLPLDAIRGFLAGALATIFGTVCSRRCARSTGWCRDSCAASCSSPPRSACSTRSASQ
jgi:predicted PurR-regulated permease PerM